MFLKSQFSESMQQFLNWSNNSRPIDVVNRFTCNDISVIYVTAHRCADGLKKLTYGRASNAIDIS